VRGWGEASDGYQVTHRPAPSAGGRHPYELLVAAEAVHDLPPGWWWFDSTLCQLIEGEAGLVSTSEAVDGVMEAAQLIGPPGAVIFVVAHFNRTLSRYPAGGTLVWRDAGVILGLLHLCARRSRTNA
jgi:SagB-type dehydrogenase family enzyme